MRHSLHLPLLLSLGALGCQSSSSSSVAIVDADPEQRAELFSAVAALEGRWAGTGPDGGEQVSTFQVTSAGSAVRELMFPGAEHEMTNMYTLDGNALVMTHFCAAGNQPHMRATAVEGDRIVFRADGVSDLKSADEVYMGEMTLVFVDEDHVEQHWRGLKGGEIDNELVFHLTRVR